MSLARRTDSRLPFRFVVRFAFIESNTQHPKCVCALFAAYPVEVSIKARALTLIPSAVAHLAEQRLYHHLSFVAWAMPMLSQFQMNFHAFLVLASKVWTCICFMFNRQVRAVSINHITYNTNVATSLEKDLFSCVFFVASSFQEQHYHSLTFVRPEPHLTLVAR